MKIEKKVSISEKKSFGSDTELGIWFWFPTPKPGFMFLNMKVVSVVSTRV